MKVGGSSKGDVEEGLEFGSRKKELKYANSFAP